MTYTGIVYISNEIRYVLATAQQVNLAAQNASLAARRAGNVRGFQAVAAELKLFSQRLARVMAEMAGDIHAIAQRVSEHYRQQHCRWMGSNEAKLNWCERASALKIDMLCLQHGGIYQGGDVERFINWFAELPVGCAIPVQTAVKNVNAA